MFGGEYFLTGQGFAGDVEQVIFRSLMEVEGSTLVCFTSPFGKADFQRTCDVEVAMKGTCLGRTSIFESPGYVLVAQEQM